MKIFNKNLTLKNFNAWSGAVETQKRIIEEGLAEDFDIMIEDLYPEGLSNVRLNDILWFEEDWLFESLGIEASE